MADVQIQQTPASDSGGAGWVWALVVLILLGVIAWFVFGGGVHKTSTTTIEIKTPSVSTPAPPSGGGAPKTP